MNQVIGPRPFLNRCPVCGGDPGTDLAAEIDSAGVARCRSCGNSITKQVLYAYWDREEAKFVAQAQSGASSTQKKWWEFWK